MELSWNETDFIEFFQVEPEVGEDREWYNYKVENDEISLSVSIWPFCGEIQLTLSKAGSTEPLIDIQLLDCPSATLKKYPSGIEYMEFANPVSNQNDSHPKKSGIIKQGIRIRIQPGIKIEIIE
ncbi:MAG: hypothetical protein JXA82_04980 [Sedimentisphaerales bacterium]|nr:hypothetical protein [Sedimentisphaerales bacterium]